MHGGSDVGNEHAQWQSHHVLQDGRELIRGDSIDIRSERLYILSGVGRQAVVYSGVLLGPRQRLNNRGRRCGHQAEALGDSLLVVGNFNTDLSVSEGKEQDEGIAASMA